MKKLGFVFAVLLALGAAGCGDDDDDGMTVDSSVTVDARAVDGAMSTVDGSTMTCSMTAPASAAAAFCTQYATTCGFTGTDRFTSMSDCMTKYQAFTATRQQCATYHLCNAGQPGAGNVTTHCPHAGGFSFCT